MVGDLSVDCPKCGERFSSSLQIDEATFVKLRLIEHLEFCRNCGYPHRFSKADYYFFEPQVPG
jgi:C4-type Zn-finger protein